MSKLSQIFQQAHRLAESSFILKDVVNTTHPEGFIVTMMSNMRGETIRINAYGNEPTYERYDHHSGKLTTNPIVTTLDYVPYVDLTDVESTEKTVESVYLLFPSIGLGLHYINPFVATQMGKGPKDIPTMKYLYRYHQYRSSKEAFEVWFDANYPGGGLVKYDGGECAISEFVEAYRIWCDANGISNQAKEQLSASFVNQLKVVINVK